MLRTTLAMPARLLVAGLAALAVGALLVRFALDEPPGATPVPLAETPAVALAPGSRATRAADAQLPSASAPVATREAQPGSRRLDVLVVDAAGAPAAGVRLRVVDAAHVDGPRDVVLASAVTSAEGRAAFVAALGGTSCALDVDAGGPEALLVPIPASPPAPWRVELPGTSSLVVSVEGALAGSVRLWSLDVPELSWRSRVCSADLHDGRARFERLRPGARLRVVATTLPPSRASAVVVAPPAPGVAHVALAGAERPSITGTLRLAGGERAAFVDGTYALRHGGVELERGSLDAVQIERERFAFLVEVAEPRAGGTSIDLFVGDARYAVGDLVLHARVELPAPLVGRIDVGAVEVEPLAPRIAGRLLAPDGAPAVGALVSPIPARGSPLAAALDPPEASDWTAAQTDEHGRFGMLVRDVPAGGLWLHAHAGREPIAAEAALLERVDADELVLRLAPVGSIEATIAVPPEVDDDEIELVVEHPDAAFESELSTDRRGRAWSDSLAPGTYRVHARLRHGGPRLATYDDVVVRPGEVTRDPRLDPVRLESLVTRIDVLARSPRRHSLNLVASQGGRPASVRRMSTSRWHVFGVAGVPFDLRLLAGEAVVARADGVRENVALDAPERVRVRLELDVDAELPRGGWPRIVGFEQLGPDGEVVGLERDEVRFVSRWTTTSLPVAGRWRPLWSVGAPQEASEVLPRVPGDAVEVAPSDELQVVLVRVPDALRAW